MHLNLCKSCGGDLERIGNYYKCNFCGNKWVIDISDDVHVVDRANAWAALRDCDFEKAVELFENIIFKDPENHEAYWGRALARASIIYVTDLDERKRVPTCNNISESSFLESPDVKKAISLAPAEISESYKKQASRIEEIRVEWLKKAKKEPAYDVFICFKDSDRERGIERTDDSYDAHELYNALTEAGFRVFFSRVSLRNKVAEHYEPYIYNAIKTAKVMVVFGERPEYFNAVWVKNEWIRFRNMIEHGDKPQNSLVIAYKGFDPSELPSALRLRQCLNAADMTFLPALISHIKRLVVKPDIEPDSPIGSNKVTTPPVITTPRVITTPPSKKKSGTARKKILSVLVTLLVISAIGAGIFALTYQYQMGVAEDVVALIDALPSFDENYYLYEEALADARRSYSNLNDWQKENVTNSDKLFAFIEKYNEHKISLVRDAANEITVDSLNKDALLKQFVECYDSLDDEQLSELPASEKTKYENYAKVYQVINQINDINNDLVNKYGNIENVKRTYLFIDEKYQALVYNYYLVDEFDVQLDFLNRLVFIRVEDGYSVKVGEGKELQGEVIIPEVYNNQPVIKIEENAFLNQRNITSVVIPDTVIEIGSGAFAGCNRLESITVPFIGEALSSSESLGYLFEGAMVPQTLKNITVTLQDKVADSCFKDLNYLECISYKSKLKYIGAESFKNCKSLKSFNSEEIGVVDLSGDMDEIGISAFENCSSIINVIFSDEVLTINKYAFSGCKNIEALNLPSRVINVGEYAFNNLEKITFLRLPSSAKNISKNSFYGCNMLTSFEVGEGLKASVLPIPSRTGYVFAGWCNEDNNIVDPQEALEITTTLKPAWYKSINETIILQSSTSSVMVSKATPTVYFTLDLTKIDSEIDWTNLIYVDLTFSAKVKHAKSGHTVTQAEFSVYYTKEHFALYSQNIINDAYLLDQTTVDHGNGKINESYVDISFELPVLVENGKVFVALFADKTFHEDTVNSNRRAGWMMTECSVIVEYPDLTQIFYF